MSGAFPTEKITHHQKKKKSEKKIGEKGRKIRRKRGRNRPRFDLSSLLIICSQFFFYYYRFFWFGFVFFLTFLGPPFLHNGEIRRPTVLNSWPRRRFNFQQPLRFYFIVSPGKGGHRHRPPPTRPTRRKCAALSFFARSTRKSAFCCCCCCCCCLAFGFVFSLFRAFSQFFFDALATPTLDVLDS